MAADTAAARPGEAQQELHPPSATRFSPEEEAVSCISYLPANAIIIPGEPCVMILFPNPELLVSGINSQAVIHACMHGRTHALLKLRPARNSRL